MKYSCCSCCKLQPKRKKTINTKKVTILVLGLDNAGKTTVVKRIIKENIDSVVPTVGFAVYDLHEKGCNVSIYDVGGGPKIRDIWKLYYPDVHGVIFIVDANDSKRIKECRRLLKSVLQHPQISGKPVLLLANKQDLDYALDEIDIVDKLQLEALVNQQKCPTLVELCSAKEIQDRKASSIANGFKWLLRNITKEYPVLNNRVLVDMASQEELERDTMDVRKKRLQDVRENCYQDTTQVEEEEDPFRPIKQLVLKTQPNGVPCSSSLPTADSEAAGDKTVVHSRSTQSEQFFRSQDWSSTSELLQDWSSRSMDLLERPKSSGALEFKLKKKKKKKRRLRVKNNKTAPLPFIDLKPSGPLPTIFDPSCQTEVIEMKDDRHNGDNSSKDSGEVLLRVSNLSRKV